VDDSLRSFSSEQKIVEEIIEEYEAISPNQRDTMNNASTCEWASAQADARPGVCSRGNSFAVYNALETCDAESDSDSSESLRSDSEIDIKMEDME
jgi:hypothetical protein